MVGIVSGMFICPRCKAPLSSNDKPEKCPNCRFIFNKEGEEVAKEFKWEKDPSRQFFEIVQQDMEKYLDKPLFDIAEEMGMPIPPEKVEDFKEMTLSNDSRKSVIEQIRTKERDIFMMKTHPDEIEGWVKSIHYLMRICVSSGNQELISKLASWGKEIGDMAKILVEYSNSGGIINDYCQTINAREIVGAKKKLKEIEKEIVNEANKEATKEDS